MIAILDVLGKFILEINNNVLFVDKVHIIV